MGSRKIGSTDGDIARIFAQVPGMPTQRRAEQYGNVALSIQASTFHYCTPRQNDLPIDQYEDVEVGFLLNGKLAHPSAAAIESFDELFEEGGSPVAGNVSQADVQRLREACVARQKAGAA